MKLQGNLVAVAVSGGLMLLAIIFYGLKGLVGSGEPPVVLTAPMPDINSAAYSNTVYATSEEAERVCPGQWVSAVTPSDDTEHFRCRTGS